jgi:crotonobetainyl-CoA hydratase
MPISLDIRDYVARVTIDRPEVMNAINATAEAELEAVWSQLEHASNVRVVVLTGAGDRAFCVGADMKSGGDHRGWTIGQAPGVEASAASRCVTPLTCR